MKASQEHPDILVVLLDCGRASDLPGGISPVNGLETLDKLRRESLTFARATTTNPWTVPAHASIFTGRFPWEHGVFLPGPLTLPASEPTLQGDLGRAGYATGLFSANGFLSPLFGLTGGFDLAAWGVWWERFLRVPYKTRPPNLTDRVSHQSYNSRRLWDAFEMEGRLLNRASLPFNLMNRTVNQLLGNHEPPTVAPWIEPTYLHWLERLPRERPTYAFVNFMDAHEPYLTPPDAQGNLSPWWKLASIRMDRANALAGRWDPSDAELTHLRRIYQASLRVLDRRIGNLISALRATDRWERTVLVVTSDHGQAFGEHHHLFHQTQVWEPILKVPLLIRFPDGSHAGRVAQGHASLIDLAPTLRNIALGASPGNPESSDLRTLATQERKVPVLAMADGVPAHDPLLVHSPPEVLARLVHPWVVGYEGDLKLVMNPAGPEVQLFDLKEDPKEDRNLYPQRKEMVRDLYQRLARIGERIRAPRGAAPATEVEERLRSWGY